MGQKLGKVLMIFGSLLLVVAVCLLPAALGQNKDEAILGAGICSFAFGALLVAGGLYLKAQALNGANAGGPANSQPKQQRGGCDLCGTEAPVIHCRVHEIHVCGNCLGKHYDFRSCVYVPSTRRQSNGKTRAARA